MIRAIPVLFALALAATPATASGLEDGPLSWSGDGRFRAELDGPVRTARCRVTTEPAGTGLTLSGKCAAPSGSASIELMVERRGGGQIAGALGSSVLDDTIQLSGTENATGFVMVSRAPLVVDDAEMRLQLELSMSETGALTLNEWLTPVAGGQTRQIVWMTLSK